MGGRCCATQLPVAPRLRLMGYGAWQHAPGTSHPLTHVLWCQLILRILDRYNSLFLISPCFTCDSLWDIAFLRSLWNFYGDYNVSINGATTANRRTYTFLPDNHDPFMCVLWICADQRERKRRIETARRIFAQEDRLYWEVRHGRSFSERFYELYKACQNHRLDVLYAATTMQAQYSSGNTPCAMRFSHAWVHALKLNL